MTKLSQAAFAELRAELQRADGHAAQGRAGLPAGGEHTLHLVVFPLPHGHAAEAAVQRLQEGRQAGIDHFVVQSVATKPEQVHSINEFIAKEVAAFPQKLTGLGTLHPDSKDMAGDIAHALELGLKGIKLHPDIQHFPLDDPRCRIIYESCQGKIPILLHTGDNRFDFSNPNRLLPVLRDFPGLTVIGAHFGGYSIWQEAAAQLHGIPNFYVDCSSTMFALPDAEVVELIRLYGADRVMFGTDYPMWSPVVELAHFQRLPLTQEERALILHKNAEAIFGIA